MSRFKKHKDKEHLCHQPKAFLSLVVILKVVEIALITIFVWKVPCTTLQDCFQSLPNSTSRGPSSGLQHYYDAYEKIADLCAATGTLCELCPLNWVAFKGKCYFLSENRNIWSLSKEDCRLRNADLLSMEDSAEEKFISEQVSLKNGHFWVGLIKNKSQWIWETGDKYQKNLPETPEEHTCATFGTNMSPESCHNPNKWICEKIMTRYVIDSNYK